MKQKLSTQCYLCGKWANSCTRDHVPPKSLAGDIPNIPFMTVPACKECNSKYSIQESRFRDFLSVIGSNQGIAEADGALRAFERSVSRRPGPNRDYQRIQQSISWKDVYSAYSIYRGTAPAISLPNDLDAESVLVKIAQGLHYIHTQQIIPPGYVKEGVLIQPHHLPPGWLDLDYPFAGQVGNFFSFLGWKNPATIDCAMWLTLFYQRALGVVVIYDPVAMRNTRVSDETMRLLQAPESR
jgi:hypothetical protein